MKAKLSNMYSFTLNALERASVGPKWTPVKYTEKNSPGPLSHHKATVIEQFAYLVGGLCADGTSNGEIYKFNIT